MVGDSFEDLFLAVARSLAMPDLAAVLTPYPVAPDNGQPARVAARVETFLHQLSAGLRSNAESA